MRKWFYRTVLRRCTIHGYRLDRYTDGLRCTACDIEQFNRLQAASRDDGCLPPWSLTLSDVQYAGTVKPATSRLVRWYYRAVLGVCHIHPDSILHPRQKADHFDLRELFCYACEEKENNQ